MRMSCGHATFALYYTYHFALPGQEDQVALTVSGRLMVAEIEGHVLNRHGIERPVCEDKG